VLEWFSAILDIDLRRQYGARKFQGARSVRPRRFLKQPVACKLLSPLAFAVVRAYRSPSERDSHMADDREKHDAELRARLEALSGRLSGESPATPESDGDKPPDGSVGQAMSMGMRAMSEFVGAVGVSALIGWQLDEWFGTSPAMLLVFLALGTAAGFYGVYRMAAKPSAGPGQNGGRRPRT
jgi:ATP synthase protein I